MAVGKGREDDLEDPYDILDCSEEAGDKEITAAYRKGSLRCHPDRNPDDPEAAEKFDRITRAKDLLLDPARRAAVDEKRRAKRALEERFAQEDSKRRRLREDLESREGEAARSGGPSREELERSRQELRKKQVQMDFNQRIRAKEADMAERQAKVVAEAQEVRAGSLDAQLHLTWRGPLPPGVDAVKSVLDGFELRSFELGEERGTATMASREDALRAVLYCRERRHQLPFRVALATAAATAAARSGRAPANTGTQPQPTPQPAAPPTAPEAGGGNSVPTTATKLSSFDEWEASMLASLQGLAKKQHEKA
mmetsp:Transcript_106078/g.300118  ORF Transcript_106078/g.300118 Transcript_106078/m.300118 type:complete len:310 (+) Transcript_106078:86-1015(+)